MFSAEWICGSMYINLQKSRFSYPSPSTEHQLESKTYLEEFEPSTARLEEEKAATCASQETETIYIRNNTKDTQYVAIVETSPRL